MLTIVIPTWNRVKSLMRCLDSILDQQYTGLSQVKIFVFDNGSDDATPLVLERYRELYPQAIEFRRGETHLDYAESFREAFTAADTEWTWTMGDDDLMMPGGLQFVLDVIHTQKYEFFHLAEKSRAAEIHAIYPGTLLELSKKIGFIDMTGFISCNVSKTKYLKAGFQSPMIELYSKSAFVQSLVLLEVLADQPCAFVDMPVIELQHANQTEETVERWRESNTSMRYNRVGEGLTAMAHAGIIPNELPGSFFRYLGGDLFGKILYTFWSELSRNQEMVADEEWIRLQDMTDLLPESESFQKSTAVFDYCSALELFAEMLVSKDAILQNIDNAFERCLTVRYPETYL